MRLLFVHHNLGALGGAETNLLLTAAELQLRGHAVSLLYRDATGLNEEEWRRVFCERLQFSEEHAAEAVEAALRQFAPDVICLHNLADLEVLEALTQSGVPVIRVVHDHTMYCLRGYKYNYFTRRVCERPASLRCVFPCLGNVARNHNGRLPLRWASFAAKRKEIRLHRKCERLVVFSDYMKQELVRNGFEHARISVLPPLLGKDGAHPPSSCSDRNLILFAGQIIRGKGVDVLLQALARLRTRFECVIAGDGNARGSCERLCARLGLQDRVRFCGFLPRLELGKLYQDTSVFAFSSVWPEPFGFAGVEAMRYGVPVVAFDVGGIREWLRDGEGGFLVPWMDVEQFSARIDQLLQNKELARAMGRRGRENSARDFSPERAVDALETLCLRTAGEPPTPAAAKPAAWLRTPVSIYE